MSSPRKQDCTTKGNFFAINKPEFAQACELGLNPAVAYLVLACGTGRDNIRTRWSCDSINRYTGMSWIRARDAVRRLETVGIAALNKPLVRRGRPLRLLRTCLDAQAIWLPKEIVVGDGTEARPLQTIRETGELGLLSCLIDLYAEQELLGDGGIPRSILRTTYDTRWIADLDEYRLLALELDRPQRERERRLPENCVDRLLKMKLLELVPHLAESDAVEAELVHALAGDAHADAAADAAMSFTKALAFEDPVRIRQHEYVLAAPRHMQRATVVGIYRLRYRPMTWQECHAENCARYAAVYETLASKLGTCSAPNGPPLDIKEIQVGSRVANVHQRAIPGAGALC